MILRLCFAFLIACTVAAPSPSSAIDIGGALQSIQSAGEFSKTLEGYYNQLMGFKDSSNFHDVGFDSCCEYADWQNDVEQSAAEAEKPAEKGAFDQLLELGKAYFDSQGQETDLTKRLTDALTSFF